MPLSKVFWLLSFATLIFIAVQLMGFDVMPVIVLLLTMNIIAVEMSRKLDKHHFKREIKGEMISRIENIEKICSNLSYHLSEHQPIAEQITFTIDRHIKAHKDAFKDDLDRIAGKMVDVENRLTKMKRLMAGAVASLDDRLKLMEEESENKEVEILADY